MNVLAWIVVAVLAYLLLCTCASRATRSAKARGRAEREQDRKDGRRG